MARIATDSMNGYIYQRYYSMYLIHVLQLRVMYLSVFVKNEKIETTSGHELHLSETCKYVPAASAVLVPVVAVTLPEVAAISGLSGLTVMAVE